MYTLQALWTQPREGLNVTTLLLSNRSYAILNMELHRVGAQAGWTARPPSARSHGTRPRLLRPGPRHGRAGTERVQNAEDLVTALTAGFSEAGPTLIEVLL